MRIVIVGGGSGGHVTPLIAVAREILYKKPRAKIELWTDKKYFANAKKLVLEAEIPVRVKKIAAGKLRRYTDFTWRMYLEHFDIVMNNLVDMLRATRGHMQASLRLLKARPDAIFLKGGYVCLPVGLAAKALKIPYMIHDSDATPGLSNRLLAKGAKRIATGMPLKYYQYNEEKAEWTGVPVAKEFREISDKMHAKLKRELGYDAEMPLVVVTGGSQGAQDINQALGAILPKLLKFTNVLLVAGRERYKEMLDLKQYEKWEEGELVSGFRMLEFSSEMWKLFGAADIVVSRAGASTMTELAAMARTVIVIPNEELPGFHQVKNAERYKEADAALVVSNKKMREKPALLFEAIKNLLNNDARRRALARNLKAFNRPRAARNIAEAVIKIAGR